MAPAGVRRAKQKITVRAAHERWIGARRAVNVKLIARARRADAEVAGGSLQCHKGTATRSRKLKISPRRASKERSARGCIIPQVQRIGFIRRRKVGSASICFQLGTRARRADADVAGVSNHHSFICCTRGIIDRVPGRASCCTGTKVDAAIIIHPDPRGVIACIQWLQDTGSSVRIHIVTKYCICA